MKKVIDLTYDIHEGMTTFNSRWHPLVSLKQLGRIPFEGRETKEISLGTHTGTHVDAPLHFIQGGSSIDEIPIERLIGKVTIIDFSHLKENGAVTKKMLENLQLENNILFKFGWGKYWGLKRFYKDYPFISKEAAQYLIDINTNIIAMDTPSPDDSRIKLDGDLLGTEADSPIHKMFLSSGIILVEYIANLDSISVLDGWNILIMPLRIKGADGSPARVCLFK